MIFTPKNCEKILRGEKTMTRRIVKSPFQVGDDIWIEKAGYASALDDEGKCPPIAAVIRFPDSFKPGYRIRYEVGKTYAIQPGRGKKAVGRILIMAIRKEWLHDITEEDARAEGVADWNAFVNLWFDLYGLDAKKGWDANPMVWRITFAAVTGIKIRP